MLLADFASVFLSLFLSAEVSEITGNRFDELFDDLYKNIDTSFKGNRKDLRDAVERIVGAGYYFRSFIIVRPSAKARRQIQMMLRNFRKSKV